MQLRFLGKSPAQGNSPSLYATDRDTYVVQGWKVTDPAILAKLNPPNDEICVEVPTELFANLANDGLYGTVARWAPPIVHVTGEGTYLIQGKHITDVQARRQMTIPESEDCVEITIASITALLLKEGDEIDQE